MAYKEMPIFTKTFDMITWLVPVYHLVQQSYISHVVCNSLSFRLYERKNESQ